MPSNEIQFYRDKMFSIVDRMIQTRPKKEVVYRPFTQQFYQQKDISRCQTGNLTKIFGKTWAGDYAYVTTLIKSPCDADIALTFRGVTEYRLNGGEWVKKDAENPFAMHEQFRDKVKVHEGYNELVIKAAEECGCILTCEEHSTIGGLGGAVCELVSEKCPVPVVRLGVNDEFGRSGTAAAVLEYYGLTAENIAVKAKETMALKK